MYFDMFGVGISTALSTLTTYSQISSVHPSFSGSLIHCFNMVENDMRSLVYTDLLVVDLVLAVDGAVAVVEREAMKVYLKMGMMTI